MDVEWDEAKRQENLRRHGLDFVGAERIFGGDIVTVEDTRHSYGEPRWVTVGRLEGRIVVLVYTERNDKLRCISLRKATRYEQRSYYAQVHD